MSSIGVAIVTGAAQGIGKGIALRLAADGFDVVLGDLPSKKDTLLEDVAQEIRTQGRKAVTVGVDVTVEDEVKGLIATTVAELGGLDVMVANAGIGLIKELVDTTVDEFDRVISVNLRGTMLCYKYAAIQMIAQGRGGRMVGASSIAGKKGASTLTAYSASKFAIRGLTQSAAQELGKHGITVNAYAPGIILTPMLDAWDEIVTSANNLAPGDHKKSATQSCAVGYNGTPADIANLVSYFASKESHFVTGQTIIVDGGRVFD